MSATPKRSVSKARTAPTDKKAGAQIDPHRVECWACGRENVTHMEVNLCVCGRWFEVVINGDGDSG